jgi:hypothetical protein
VCLCASHHEGPVGFSTCKFWLSIRTLNTGHSKRCPPVYRWEKASWNAFRNKTNSTNLEQCPPKIQVGESKALLQPGTYYSQSRENPRRLTLGPTFAAVAVGGWSVMQKSSHVDVADNDNGTKESNWVYRSRSPYR